MKTLNQMASLFGGLAAGAYRSHLSPTLDLIGAHVKAEVEKEIGEYQGAIGPYSATAELSDVTIDRKLFDGLGKGADPNTPLWATGAYHDSIQVSKDMNALAVEIGTDVDYVVYHELGTSKMPPRPVFGPATLRAIPPILPLIAQAAGMGISGGVWTGLGAKGTTFTEHGDSAEVQP